MRAATKLALEELGQEEVKKIAAEALEERELFAKVESAIEDRLRCSSCLGDVVVPRRLAPSAAAGQTLRAVYVPSTCPRVAFRALSAQPDREGWSSAGRRRRGGRRRE